MTADDDDADGQPDTVAAGNDETTIVPPPTESGPTQQAWSLDEEDTKPVEHHPWGLAWGQAAAFLAVGAVIATVTAVVSWALTHDKSSSHSLPPAPTTTAIPTVAVTVATAPQPSTVTVQASPSTVTVPAPTTVTTQAAALPPANGGTDVFTTCPDGREGVVGGRTTCAFAANVRQIFYASGMSNNFTAFSPVTGEGYEMTCVGRYPAYFSDGSTKVSTRCYGGDNAEVVIW